MQSIFTNVDLFLWIAEIVNTLSGMSKSDLVITIVVFLLLKGQFNLEIKINLNSASKQTRDNKDENM
ncbi:hypothetical protein [Priestia megaterium]|uniref:hypothetical protein n=1 Tax=Priestia megaterium TaxID=1404 RepID=UPI0012D8CBF5|nr:hypothetical protein [Priestia megaterium]MUL34755.1 hypothetical protein [Priestia megaterium]